MYEETVFSTSTPLISALTHGIIDRPMIDGRNVSGYVIGGGPLSGEYHLITKDGSKDVHENVYKVSHEKGTSITVSTVKEKDLGIIGKLEESLGPVNKLQRYETKPLTIEHVQNLLNTLAFNSLRLYMGGNIPYFIGLTFSTSDFNEEWITVYRHGCSIGSLMLELADGVIKDAAYFDNRSTNIIEAENGVINAQWEGAAVINCLMDAVENGVKNFILVPEVNFPSIFDKDHIREPEVPPYGVETVRMLYEYSEKLKKKSFSAGTTVCSLGNQLYHIYALPSGGLAIKYGPNSKLKILFDVEKKMATFTLQERQNGVEWVNVGANVTTSFDSCIYAIHNLPDVKNTILMLCVVAMNIRELYQRYENPVPMRLNAWNDENCVTIDRVNAYLWWLEHRFRENRENVFEAEVGGKKFRICIDPENWRYTIRGEDGRLTIFGKSSDTRISKTSYYVGEYLLGHKNESIHQFMDPFFWEFINLIRDEYRKEAEDYPFVIDTKAAYLQTICGFSISCGHQNSLKIGEKEITISNYLGLHVNVGKDSANVYADRHGKWEETFISVTSNGHYDDFYSVDGKICGYGIGGQLLQMFLEEWTKYFNGERQQNDWVLLNHSDTVYEHFGWPEEKSYCPVSNFGVLRKMIEGYQSKCEPGTRVIFKITPDYDKDVDREDEEKHLATYAELVDDKLVFTYGCEREAPMLIVQFENPSLTKLSWSTNRLHPIIDREFSRCGFIDCTVHNCAGVRELGLGALGDSEHIFENVSYGMWSTFCSLTDPYIIEKPESAVHLKKHVK